MHQKWVRQHRHESRPKCYDELAHVENCNDRSGFDKEVDKPHVNRHIFWPKWAFYKGFMIPDTRYDQSRDGGVEKGGCDSESQHVSIEKVCAGRDVCSSRRYGNFIFFVWNITFDVTYRKIE